MEFELVIRTTEEKRAVVKANSKDEALKMYENGELNFKEIDGSLTSDIVEIKVTDANAVQLMENILSKVERKCSGLTLQTLVTLCVNNYKDSIKVRSNLQTVENICLNALAILLLQYDREDLLKFMVSRAHWYKRKTNPEDYLDKLMIDILENSKSKKGISMKPILYLLATVAV